MKKQEQTSAMAPLMSQQGQIPLNETRPSISRTVIDTATSFASGSHSADRSSSDASLDDVLNISKYIPVGSLRLQRIQCGISRDSWESLYSWAAFAHHHDAMSIKSGMRLPDNLQAQLLNSSVMNPYRALHDAGWIRMEFKANGPNNGQARVYVFPDDVGRRAINKHVRSLRRLMQQLLAQLDISRTAWNGEWKDSIPIAHLDSSLDRNKHEEPSLFEIFNTLPSPDPNPESVFDKYAKSAMYDILDSNIIGLTTTLYNYQRRSAAMMLQREAQVSQLRDPRLREMTAQNDTMFYCDPDTATCLLEPRFYDSDRGGILAENMGLGKTLISLALILATKGMSPRIPIEYSIGTTPVRKKTGSLLDMAAAVVCRTGAPWLYAFNRAAEDLEFVKCAEAIRRNRGYYFLPAKSRRRQSRVILPEDRKIWLTDATIVVVPANLVKQWVQEINKHTTGLKILVVSNGKDRLPPAEEIVEYDILLFSRQRFDKEAQDGSDPKGRRTSTPKECHCPYIGSSRERDCTCLKEEHIYRSPLKDLHFKRLITDEGHIFGNASKSSITDASTVVRSLQVESKWIVSGTPTQGLYGTEPSRVSSESSSVYSSPACETDNSGPLTPGDISLATYQLSNIVPLSKNALYKQERKDLEKLGNIATLYLKVRPWANTAADNDVAQWSHYVMQPRHGSKSHGNIECLKSALENMIIRNRPIDIENDVVLPPLHQKIVTLDGSFQDKLSLNMFSMMIVSNAITSERKDADYLFHPRQRAALDLLVKNLRQASFHWAGFSLEDVRGTTDIARDFLEKGKVPITPEDKTLLEEAIRIGEIVLSNTIKQAASWWHEMPMYIQNKWPESVRAAWSLDGERSDPTMMGATMLRSCQKFVDKQLWKEDLMDGLEEAGKDSLRDSYIQINPKRTSKKVTVHNNVANPMKRVDQWGPDLAGGIVAATIEEPSPVKRSRMSSLAKLKPALSTKLGLADETTTYDEYTPSPSNIQSSTLLKSALKSSATDIIRLDPDSPLASTKLISTSSAKLTYLMQRIIAHHKTEKILVFYESENVAYYIAQALEVLHIKHLIYAKTLPSTRKSQYVVTFNQTETFRVLLMDITQAAFGLDMSSASRVYFVNPVFSPQVEAQAVKRAHRIGQKRPVYVETLILKGGIEEVILERRQDMSQEELKKCKNILNDQKIYDWIRNVRFIPVPFDIVPGPDQMAALDTPEPVFGRSRSHAVNAIHDPDADLIMDTQLSGSGGKRKAGMIYGVDSSSSAINKPVKKKKTVAFGEPSYFSQSLVSNNPGRVDERPRLTHMEGVISESPRRQTEGYG